MFWKSKDRIKSKCSVFSSFKQRIKVCMVYLECKLQEYRYGWCLFDIKCNERYIEHIQREANNKQGIANVFRC